MYLKSLTLKGFKSFADKSILSVEPGVTCVVGPNGSGKSNITDAILWVLGEQSAKTLRGTAMEDIIFAGSTARKAVGIAEVEIVLDNSDKTVALEFDEVTFTRRMYRSGESEYLINKTPSRLMDILDLLHDSGLGRDMHSVISQGKIDEILKSKPEQRRALIEEAAGVLKHKKRKDRALRKLSMLDAHLERAGDITTEIQRQLRPMKRAAKRAEANKEYATQLRELEVALAVDDLRTLQGQWDRVKKHEKEAESVLDLAKYNLTNREQELSKLQHLLEEKGLFVGDIAEQRSRMGAILERIDGSNALLGEKSKNLIARHSELQQSVAHAREKIGDAKAEVASLEEKRVEVDGRMQGLYTQLATLRRDSESIRKERNNVDGQVAKAESEVRVLIARSNEMRISQQKLEQSIISAETQKDMVTSRSTTLKQAILVATEGVSNSRAKLEELAGQLQSAKRKAAAAQGDIDMRVRILEARKKTVDQCRETLLNTRAELKGLEEINRAVAGATPAIEEIALSRTREEGYLGLIADAITADKDYENIVETLLGSDLYGVLVSDNKVVSDIVQHIKGRDKGELSLLPLAGLRNRREKCKVGVRLVEQLDVREEYKSAVEALLGDVIVVESLDQALVAAQKHSNLRFATPFGAVVWPTGKVTLGAQINDTEGLLVRKRRLLELEDSLPHLVDELSLAESEVSDAEVVLSSAQQDAFDISQHTATVQGEHDALLASTSRGEENLTALVAENQSHEALLVRCDRSLEVDVKELTDCAGRLVALEAGLSSAQDALGEIQIHRDSVAENEKRIGAALGDCQVEIAGIVERDIYLKRMFVAATTEAENLESVITGSKDTQDSLDAMMTRIEPLKALYHVLVEQAQRWAIMLRDRASLEQADSSSLKDTINGARDLVKDAQVDIDDRSEDLTEIRIDKGKLELQVNSAVSIVIETHGMPIELAVQLPVLESRDKCENQASALRKKMSNLGAVNPIAQEEYMRLKERADFMDRQVADLKSARSSLYKVIGAIDRKMREKFLDAFEEVDKHFQRIFGVLFPGGNAQLIMDDIDNPDTSGVDFIVQPRGKKVRKMSLLSGGENSLAALALLFALNEVSPSPFYVLDEVEAALDDSNLRRFVHYINTMRGKTQFLIVTHQRRTMEMADWLYGVTMQADGVSKMVSQKLDSALKTAGIE